MHPKQRAHEKQRIKAKHQADALGCALAQRMAPKIAAIRAEVGDRFLRQFKINPRWFFTSPVEDPVAKMLHTGMSRFDTVYKVDGLVKFNAEIIEVLALVSQEPRKGNCRAFIHQLQRCWPVVIVWHVTNGHLRRALERYGFRHYNVPLPMESRPTLDGMVWFRNWPVEITATMGLDASGLQKGIRQVQSGLDRLKNNLK